MMTSTASESSIKRKTLWIIRHGQAQHNPRAEAAKAKGCSHEEFLHLMKLDDALDADLTSLGTDQARLVVQENRELLDSILRNEEGEEKNNATQKKNPVVVVSSPLSRALKTAEIVMKEASALISGTSMSAPPTRNLVLEDFREINGLLLNAQRRSKTELMSLFPTWDFSDLQSDEDDLWSASEMETQMACAERGYRGFLSLTELESMDDNAQQRILLVCHGGILRFAMQQHPKIQLEDGRQQRVPEQSSAERDSLDSVPSTTKGRSVDARFANCEVRKYELSRTGDDNDIVVLREVDT